MAKRVRNSKRLQQISWECRELRHRQEIICCFLHAFQESISYKELNMELPPVGGPSNLALDNVLIHTQSLRSLSLSFGENGLLEDKAVATASSEWKKNTTLQEFELRFSLGATNFSPHFDQSARPSSPSQAMFAWACD